MLNQLDRMMRNKVEYKAFFDQIYVQHSVAFPADGNSEDEEVVSSPDEKEEEEEDTGDEMQDDDNGSIPDYKEQPSASGFVFPF